MRLKETAEKLLNRKIVDIEMSPSGEVEVIYLEGGTYLKGVYGGYFRVIENKEEEEGT